MSQDDVTMTKAQFQTILRLARAEAWDEGWNNGADYMADDADALYIVNNPHRSEATA